MLRKRSLLESMGWMLTLSFLAGAAPAATFVVTRTDDTNDGACDSDCSLREAVIAANASIGADTIVLPAGAYDLTIPDQTPGTDEDGAVRGDLDIAGGGLTISGAGSAVTSIDARGLGNRIFHVLRQFSSSPIVIEGVSLENGDSSSLGLSAGAGSAIRIDESFPGTVVTLDDVVIEHSAGSSAVRSVATLHVVDSLFVENAVDAALELATLGQNKTGSAATQISGTTFRQNDGFAVTAVKNESKSHAFQIFNSTFSANSAAGASGIDAAIFTTNSGQIWNTTIADDQGYGLGALADFFGTPTVEVQNTIFDHDAHGSVMPLGATDGAVLPVSDGGNVLFDGGAGAFGLASDHPNVDPKTAWDPPQFVYQLDPGSAAIDAGLNAGPLGCPSVDQLGAPRPQDGNRDGIAICDAGAVEAPEPEGALLGAGAVAAIVALRRRRARTASRG